MAPPQIGFLLWSIPLVFTLAIEVPVAALFGLRGRGLWAVVLIDVITNPALNIVVLVLYGLGIGFSGAPYPAWFSYAWYFYPLILLLEAVVVLVEWRMLVWALDRERWSSRRLLAASLGMNAASFAAGLLAARLRAPGSW